MDKNELEKIYKILYDCDYNFRIAHRDYKNGKNAKIRKDAERKMDNEIELAKTWIYRNPDVYNLASGGDNSSATDRAMYIEETFWVLYFARDMDGILKKLKALIDSIPDATKDAQTE